ncbi:MAG: helix-turn-helix transcriptional regulator [Phycisphaerales bacterium]|nr:helix-turn-helix transcriptional regulator [Phycisphaerales bacterium]
MTTNAPKSDADSAPETLPFFIVEDIETMQILASPARWEVLDATSALGECSAAEIAEFTARARTSLYPHIQKLVECGLIYETGTRLMGKRYEQLYRPKAVMIGTRFNQDDQDNLDYHADFANALARQMARKHIRAASEKGVNPRTQQRNHHCGGHSVWVDDKQLAKLNSMIDEIWKFCENSRPGEGKQLLHLGLFMSRHLPKEKKSSRKK